jgi:Fur family ferric uptake transcriptional regulator
MVSELATIAVSASPAEKFREYLATRGKRLTRERETIVAEVFASHEHFDTDQLVNRLSSRTDGKRVSRATVYRTLDDMVLAGCCAKSPAATTAKSTNTTTVIRSTTT